MLVPGHRQLVSIRVALDASSAPTSGASTRYQKPCESEGPLRRSVMIMVRMYADHNASIIFLTLSLHSSIPRQLHFMAPPFSNCPRAPVSPIFSPSRSYPYQRPPPLPLSACGT